MNKTILVAVALLVCVSASAGSLLDDQPQGKTFNRSIGASLMGKTFKCNGVSMSYLISEQGTMAFHSIMASVSLTTTLPLNSPQGMA
jgi:hypothetical protein